MTCRRRIARSRAHVHTADAQGMLPNAAMALGAFYHNGLVWGERRVFRLVGDQNRAGEKAVDSIRTGGGRRAAG